MDVRRRKGKERKGEGVLVLFDMVHFDTLSSRTCQKLSFAMRIKRTYFYFICIYIKVVDFTHVLHEL